MRIRNIRILTWILFVILLAGLFNLQVLKGETFFSLSNRNCIRVIPYEGMRGRIFDCNGQVIADNRIAYNVSILYNEFKKAPETKAKLAKILDKSASWIDKTVKKELVSAFTPVVLVRDATKKIAFFIEENKFDLPGVIVQTVPARRYPYGSIASHVLGYLAPIDRWRITRLKDYGYKLKDVVGFGGVEESLEQFLRAEEGGTQIQVDHRGRINKVLGFKPAGNGRDVHLTIDIRIQKIFEEAFTGKKGAAVLMEAATGRVIALLSSPGFYPGSFLEAGGSAYVSQILTSPDAPLFNRAISGKYPLGSIFKVVSAVAGLETGKITWEKRVYCPGKMLVGNKEFNCWSLHHSQDLIEAMAHSCNVYFYRLALLLGADRLSEYSLKFGLGRASGIDLPYETAGNVPSVLSRRIKLRSWYDGDTANFGIGQGDLLVSPIQAARLMAALANGGRLVRPYVVGKVGEEERLPHDEVNLKIAPENLEPVNEGIKEVVNLDTGTANIGDWKGLRVAGKTGTAQARGKLSHGWFAGFFPYDKPRFAFCVFLEHTGPSIHSVILAQQIFTRLKEEDLI